jgi:ATP-dependent DNA helicase MPH1
MSSDGYFDDELDSAFLNEVDAIEAAHLPPKKPTPVVNDSDDFDFSMDFDDAELQQLDNFIEDSLQGKAAPVPGPSRMRQTTLWGQAPPEASTSKPKPVAKSFTRTASAPFGKPARKTKEWDRTAFAKSGWKKPKEKPKAHDDDEGNEEEEEVVEFEQFPAPFVSRMSKCFLPFYCANPCLVGYVRFAS